MLTTSALRYCSEPGVSAELTRIANLPSWHRMRAEYQGWKFGPVKVMEHLYLRGTWAMRGTFTCVCGTAEQFEFLVDDSHIMLAVNTTEEMLREIFDPGTRLYRFGSFSRKHLLDDGYSAEQVAEFERKGREFDERYRGEMIYTRMHDGIDQFKPIREGRSA